MLLVACRMPPLLDDGVDGADTAVAVAAAEEARRDDGVEGAVMVVLSLPMLMLH